MKIVLSQPQTRCADFSADLDALLANGPIPECDILVLPELIGACADTHFYQQQISALAKQLGCYVVGGSHYLPEQTGLVNAGIVCDATGNIVSRYQKVRPYGSELGRGVVGGSTSGRFTVAGREIVVLICSDLWFSDSFSDLHSQPDVILIPSFSITQKQNPESARQLWQHMTIARAYEYAAYVGVSDWAHPCRFDGLAAAGVTGFADPRPSGDCYHQAQDQVFATYDLDFNRLDVFRDNRAGRGFLHQPQRSGVEH